MSHSTLGSPATVPLDVDVIQISDFRLPGGTSSSIAEEVRAQSDAGLRTALIHTPSVVTSRPIPWSRQIRGVLDLPGVHVATPRDHVRGRLIVLRHPTVAASSPWTFDCIRAEQVVLVVNHSAIDAGGAEFYDVEATDARMQQIFGVEPIWAPIGPVVRQTVLQQTRQVPLRTEDWVNVFHPPADVSPRRGFIADVPVIGRHSRPQPGKWPDTREDTLAAYPDSPGYRVEILGGAEVPERILGEVPPRWSVVPFGAEQPETFLRRIDFWVYFHHPDLREAFGRAAMEALAAGAVVILPEYMRELFGDAALYGAPQDVRPIVDTLYADQARFLAQSRNGQEFVLGFGPEVHLARLAELGVTPRSAAPAPAVPAPAGPSPGGASLHLTLDDDGDLALARLVAAAEHGGAGERPVLVVVSTQRPTSVPDGVPFQHIPSHQALVAPEDAWQEYLLQRLGPLVVRLGLDRVVLHGDAQLQGLTTALEGQRSRPSRGSRHGDVASSAPADPGSWSDSLEQWAGRLPGSHGRRAPRPVPFAPHYAPRPRQYDEIPVVLVLATQATSHLHHGLLDGVRLLQEATYGFRPLVVTDDVTAPALRTFEWAVEHVMAEDDWYRLSQDNWLAMAADQVRWLQQHYGTTSIVAPTTRDQSIESIWQLARQSRAPHQVASTAAQLAADGAAAPPAETAGLRGWWSALPAGRSSVVVRLAGSVVELVIHRGSGDGLLIAMSEDTAGEVARRRGWSTVTASAGRDALSGPVARRIVRAARDGLAGGGPILLLDDGAGPAAVDGTELTDGVLTVGTVSGAHTIAMSYGSSLAFGQDELGAVLDGLCEVHRRSALPVGAADRPGALAREAGR